MGVCCNTHVGTVVADAAAAAAAAVWDNGGDTGGGEGCCRDCSGGVCLSTTDTADVNTDTDDNAP